MSPGSRLLLGLWHPLRSISQNQRTMSIWLPSKDMLVTVHARPQRTILALASIRGFTLIPEWGAPESY